MLFGQAETERERKLKIENDRESRYRRWILGVGISFAAVGFCLLLFYIESQERAQRKAEAEKQRKEVESAAIKSKYLARSSQIDSYIHSITYHDPKKDPASRFLKESIKCNVEEVLGKADTLESSHEYKGIYVYEGATAWIGGAMPTEYKFMCDNNSLSEIGVNSITSLESISKLSWRLRSH